MNLEKILADQIGRSCVEVFSTMLGMELPPWEAAAESGIAETNDGVVSIVGLAGAWVGSGSLTCSPAFACRICSLLLMADFPGVNEDVLDAMAELTNIVIGGVKNRLEPRLGPLGMSIPTVVYGKNLRTRSARKTEWTVVRFRCDEEVLTIRVFLESAERQAHILPHASLHHYSLEV